MTKRPAEILTRDEARALLAAASPRSLTGTRTRALIALGWAAGLRCSEALALRNADIDLRTGSVRVLRGKGAKARTTYLHPEALAIVEAWITAKREAEIKSRMLICGIAGQARGKPMDTPGGTRTVRAMMTALGERAGIEKRVHFHMLRHTFAAELDAEGKSHTVIQKALGHTNLATTAIYLDHVSAADVGAALTGRSWSGDGDE